MTEAMVELDQRGDVFVLTLTAGENRWNTTFVRAIDAALDEVEASAGPAALVMASGDPKFFSNGLDLDWMRSRDEHPGGERKVFAREAMTLFGRMIPG
jgi:Delta3-Delta2-enoyl-CoA isomerase